MRQNDFDKVCNSERGWAFERVVDSQLEGYDHKIMDSVESRGECARMCIQETDFDCRSAEYDMAKRICSLSREDRRTQPEAFRAGGATGIDYIENQCAKGKKKEHVNIFIVTSISFFESECLQILLQSIIITPTL